jgi:DNA-binding transcriptional regulator LsrR (DeoR family)
MLAVAMLAAEGRRQVNIAELLGLGEVRVSRLLRDARRARYLREEIRFLKEDLPDHLLLKVRDRIVRKAVTDRLRSFMQGIPGGGPIMRVFNCDAHVSNARKRVEQLSQQAAPYLKKLLERSQKCGLTWGGMLRGAVSALSELHFQYRTPPQIRECIPLSGEPLGNEPMRFSSSSLAHDLGQIVNGDSYNAPSLAMVPAFIPEGFSKSEVSGVWKLIGLVRSYGMIFGRRSMKNGEKPLAEHLDMLLTSVGPAESPLGFGQGRLFETGKLKIDDLRELVLGDIGGVCVPRPDLKQTALRKLQDVNERWTGLRLEHVQACAAQAKDPDRDRPGVVVISGGKARARFIYEITRRGLINHLIIDDELAKELDTIVGEVA